MTESGVDENAARCGRHVEVAERGVRGDELVRGEWVVDEVERRADDPLYIPGPSWPALASADALLAWSHVSHDILE